MKVKNCQFKNPLKTCFYDGTPKSAKFIENNFEDFEYINWIDEKWVDRKLVKTKGKFLVYFNHDGEYQNVVPSNVHIVQFKTHLTITDWFTEEEFNKELEIC